MARGTKSKSPSFFSGRSGSAPLKARERRCKAWGAENLDGGIGLLQVRSGAFPFRCVVCTPGDRWFTPHDLSASPVADFAVCKVQRRRRQADRRRHQMKSWSPSPVLFSLYQLIAKLDQDQPARRVVATCEPSGNDVTMSSTSGW